MTLGEAYVGWGGHLFVVVTLPAADGSVALVNLSHWEANRDESCIVDVGDHPWVTKKSIVLYREAQILSVTEQAAFLKTAGPQANISDALLERIQNGTDSDHTPQKVERAVRASWTLQKLAKR